MILREGMGMVGKALLMGMVCAGMAIGQTATVPASAPVA